MLDSLSLTLGLTAQIFNSYRLKEGVSTLGDWAGIKDWQEAERTAITHMRVLGAKLINQRNGGAGGGHFTSGASIELMDGDRFERDFARIGGGPLTFLKPP